MRRRGRPRGQHAAATTAVLVAALLLAASGTAWTAGLTGLPQASVGRSSTPFPTYAVGAPTFSDAAGATTVSFSTSPPAGQVQARVQVADGPPRAFERCATTDAGTTWTCPVSGLTLEQAQVGQLSTYASP